jgi:hypothetical protein
MLVRSHEKTLPCSTFVNNAGQRVRIAARVNDFETDGCPPEVAAIRVLGTPIHAHGVVRQGALMTYS